MVSVYKTNVEEHSEATSILDAIRQKVPGSDPIFNLEDCDKVLRVENCTDQINDQDILEVLQEHGYDMEKLL